MEAHSRPNLIASFSRTFRFAADASASASRTVFKNVPKFLWTFVNSWFSLSTLESVLLRNELENADSQVIYQPEGVSLRFNIQPEANAFRLIRPYHRNDQLQFKLLSGTLSLAAVSERA